MAITLFQLPSGSFFAARNRQKYILLTDNYITTPGVKHQSIVQLSSNPTDGQTLECVVGTTTVTLTFKNTPAVDTDVQIGASAALTAANLLLVTNRTFFFFTNYLMSGGGSLITFDAREYGPEWDMDFTGSTAAISTLDTGGVTEVVEDTFRFYAYLYVLNGSDYELVIPISLIPDADQMAELDIAEPLLAQLEYDLPIYNNTTVSQGSKSLKSFLLRLWEYYDADGHNGTEQTFAAHLGGLKEKETTTIEYAETYFTHATLQRFLTRHPRTGQPMTSTQQAFLYLYQKTGLGDAYVRLVIVHTDGTQVAIEQKYTINQPGNIVIIPAGYAQLTLDTHKSSGKTVAEWYLQVWYGSDFQSADATTEGYQFNLDTGYYPNNRHFQLGNSVGGFDPLWCTGIAVTGLDAQGEDYQVNPPDNSETKILGSNSQERALIKSPITLNTGWMDKDRVDFYSNELAASEEVYEVIGGQYVKVIVDRSSIKDLYDDNTENYAFTFSYTYAQEDRV